ncbi:hypothetical protein [Bradyrhizobium sp. CB2312]|uniref:hypothetical protein n=1 Tax=Bradyrhizobium sp. CB2312 TaxID=3039155 RepID=UPI0024B09773|nr:hypothetical protein [Bradyrhizobium sp. CB2312]WFU71529.1 hypothetical protein QA642_41255 [Bradyrhizobium sp. CB2312]
MIISSLGRESKRFDRESHPNIFLKRSWLLDEFWRADVNVLVWKQPAAGDKLSGRCQSATSVVEALLGRARSEKIARPTKSFFGDILLTSAGCLLSMPQIGCPEHMQDALARKRRLAVHKARQAAQMPPHE